jgi:two-component system response regulator PilR (NtrC family)
VGETQEEPLDVRIISATHQNLAALVAGGRFRQDLFYRLNVIELRMPPLRECRDDIPGIAASILERLARQNEVPAARLDDSALQALVGYDFPGNVRELENILERALALSGHELISAEDLQLAPAREEREPAEGGAEGAAADSLPQYLDEVERKTILEALGKTGFNRTAAAKLLGISFRQLRYRMQRLAITDEDR